MATSNPACEIRDVELGNSPINDVPPPPAYGARDYTADYATDDAPPPSYDEAAKDAPPSYAALYGQMQDASEEAKNPLEYIIKVLKILLSTACVTIFMIVVLAIPLAMVVIGSVFFHDCPVQDNIPIFLIVMGTTYIIKNVADLRSRWKNQDNPEAQRESAQNFASRILGCFIIFFFIAGNVWIYSIYPVVQTDDPTNPTWYCNPVLYYFSFWLMTVVYIVCALTCCCICCAAGAAATGGRTDSGQE